MWLKLTFSPQPQDCALWICLPLLNFLSREGVPSDFLLDCDISCDVEGGGLVLALRRPFSCLKKQDAGHCIGHTRKNSAEKFIS